MNIQLSQDIINKLSTYSEDRRKTREAAYDRIVHNDLLQQLCNELSEDLDE